MFHDRNVCKILMKKVPDTAETGEEAGFCGIFNFFLRGFPRGKALLTGKNWYTFFRLKNIM